MSLNNNQRSALNRLYQYRENIENYLAEIDAILMVYFPQNYHIFNQHLMPQIKTALRENTKWLSRGEYSMDDILRVIEDQIKDQSTQKGVSKFIK